MIPGTRVLLAAVTALCLTSAGAEARKVALVIGNERYQHLESLQKAAADAAGYAEVLNAKGFDQVTLKQNLTRDQMDEAIADFVAAIGQGDVAVFVYSGHGWSNGSQNFIIGTDAPDTASEERLARIAIPVANGLNGIVDEMTRKGASLKVAIVDACRNNPFRPPTGGKAIGFGRGFNRLKEPPPDGTFMVFSAGAGQVALDRLSDADADPHGVFTRTFLPLLRTDLTLLDATKTAQERVFELAKAIGHDQLPAYYDEVKGKACLAGTCEGPTPPPTGGLAAGGDPVAADYALAAQVATVAAWDAFLAKHSHAADSFHVRLAQAARQKLAALSPAGAPIAPPLGDSADQAFDASRAVPVMQVGHGDLVLALAASPDGRLLASGSEDYTARLWDAATGHVLRIFQAHTDKVRAVSFSPDGRSLATAGDRTVRLWDVRSGQLYRTLALGDLALAVAFSPDGKALAAGAKTVQIWDANTGQPLRSLATPSDESARSIAFSPDGRVVAVAYFDEVFDLWDAEGGTLLRRLEGHASWVNAVVFSPDGKLLGSASDDGTVKVWDVATGMVVRSFADPMKSSDQDLYQVGFAPDGRTIAAVASGPAVLIWDVAGARLLRTIALTYEARTVAFARDGRELFAADRDGIKRFDPATGVERGPFAARRVATAVSLAVSPDGASLLAGSRDGAARLWNIAGAKLVRRFQHDGSSLSGIAFSPDGTKIVTGSQWGAEARLWEVATGRVMAALGGDGYFGSVGFTPDGKTFVTGHWDNIVRIWDATTGKALRSFKGRQRHGTDQGASELAFSSDGKVVAMIGYDQATIWNLANGRHLRTLEIAKGILNGGSFSPDGKTFAAGTSEDYVGVILDATRGRILQKLTGHSEYIHVVAFSRDGKRIITGSFDGTAKVWDASSGRLMATLGGTAGAVFGVGFSPDGKWIATLGGQSVKLWSGEDYSLHATLIGLDGDNFIVLYPDGSYYASEGAGEAIILVDGLRWSRVTAEYEAAHRRKTASLQ